jgi:transcriptional regulator with PAS, ATPase and Fis domain
MPDFPSDYCQTILKDFPDGVLILDRDRTVQYANPAFYRLFELDPGEEVAGKKCFDVARTALCDTQCLMGRAEMEDRTTIQRHSVSCDCPGVGPLCMTHRIFGRAEAEPGEPYSMAIFKGMADLGNYLETLRTTSLELEQEKDKLSVILDAIAEGYFTLDASLVLTGASDSLLRFLNKRREEVVGKACQEVFHSDKCESDCPVRWTLKHHKPVANCRERVLDAEDRPKHVLKSTYLQRDVSGEITGVIAIVRDNSELVALQKRAASLVRAHGFVTKNKRMQEVLDLIHTIKDTDTSVLILGESGTGKEMLANAIVQSSVRISKPFIKINCSALTENLLESELFGHIKGAFTGAISDKAGKFELADEGTLFLDEVGDMSPPLQAKVLRVLQEKEFERVGGSRTQRVDVRILAATNKDLKEAIRRGEFREDLFYRLNVIPIQIPPLRERKEDIPLLVNHFVDLFNQKYRKTIQEVSSRALALLVEYPWPGNVRELRNALEYAFVCSKGTVLERPALPVEVQTWRGQRAFSRREAVPSSTSPSTGNGKGPKALESGGEALPKALEDRDQVLKLLARFHGNRSRLAKEMGIGRTTLWRRLSKLGIEETYH